jgi:TonB family protein
MRSLILLYAALSSASVFGQGALGAYDHSLKIEVRREGRSFILPLPVSIPTPSYPAKLARDGFSGEATVRFFVGADGSTRDLSIVSATLEEFASAVKVAVAQWKFESDGPKRPLEVWLRVRVIFRKEAD